MLSISIVIYHLDAGLLNKLLASLQAAVKNLDFPDREIVVTIIDNNNQEDAISQVLNGLDNLSFQPEIISGIKNIGYGRAHNLAILKSKSKYHLILNPDVILDEKSLNEGIGYLESNPEVCAAAPYSVDQDGTIQFLSKSYPSVFDLLLRGLSSGLINNRFRKRLNHYENREITEKKVPAEVDIISGCFMLCRTDNLKKVGGFDERYFLYFEDFALSLELKKYGALHYLPRMKIIHYGGNAARKGLKHIFMFVSSGTKFFNQYGWKFI